MGHLKLPYRMVYPISSFLRVRVLNYAVLVRQDIIPGYTSHIHFRYAVIIHLAKSGIVQQLVYKDININSWLPGCGNKYHYLHQRRSSCNHRRWLACLSFSLCTSLQKKKHIDSFLWKLQDGSEMTQWAIRQNLGVFRTKMCIYEGFLFYFWAALATQSSLVRLWSADNVAV